MFRHFINNTKFQFFVLLSVLILSFTAVIIYLNYNLNLINETNAFNENLNKITVSAVNLKYSLDDFVYTEHNNDFYEMSTDEFADAVYDSKNLLAEVNDELMNFRKADHYQLTPLLKQNMVLLNDFETSFYLYVTNKVEIGNSEYGFILNLNLLEERLDINFIGYPPVAKQFNDLKILKEIYLSSLEPNSAEQFIKGLEELQNDVIEYKTVIIDDREVRFVADALAMYLSSFEQIYSLDRVNGTNFYAGLYQNLGQTCDELIINITAIIDSSKLQIVDDLRKFKIRIILLIIFSAGIFIATIILLYRIFTIGLSKISLETKELAFDKSKEILFNTGDFFEQIFTNLKTHKENLKHKEFFIKKLQEKEFEENSIVDGDDDMLGKSLAELRESLIIEEKNKVAEAEIRMKEDKQKSGIAQFGRILRRHVGDIDSLSYELIAELVQYIEADIGGLYVVDPKAEIPTLKLRASFAYNEQKIISKSIPFGEGLVGTCAVDRQTFYFDKVDESYIKIVSGFGHSKPESLLISPIFVEDEVYGVLELASTKKFNESDIEFIEILAEDIAYTLSYLLSLEVKEE